LVYPRADSELRLKEAVKLGFSRAVVPAGTKADVKGLALDAIRDVGELTGLVAGETRASPQHGKMRS